MNQYRRIQYEDRCQIYALSKRGVGALRLGARSTGWEQLQPWQRSFGARRAFINRGLPQTHEAPDGKRCVKKDRGPEQDAGQPQSKLKSATPATRPAIDQEFTFAGQRTYRL